MQMATGSGKTFTAITSSIACYVDAKRILFLVDTKNCGSCPRTNASILIGAIFETAGPAMRAFASIIFS